MKIATFSYRDFEVNRHGWNRSGNRVAYKSSGINREGTSLPYYTLSFDYTPIHDHDIVLFAHCYPYAFTDLDSFLQKKVSKKR